jgi:hypothetical protein
LLAATFLLAISAKSGSAAEDCPTGNLLAGKVPLWWAEVLQVERLTDGVFGFEGAAASSDLTSILTSKRAEVRFDLGRTLPIDAARLQGDGYAAFQVEISDDDAHWRPLWIAPQQGEEAGGLRTRSAQGLGARARYVRLRALYRHTVSELELYCGAAAAYLPAPVRGSGRISPPTDPSQTHARARLAIGVLALLSFGALRVAQGRARPALLGLGASLAALSVALSLSPRAGPWLLLAAIPLLVLAADRLRGRAVHPRTRVRLATFALLSVTAVCAWTNFGAFKYTTTLHYWDAFHYVLGARYFPENRYELLYECVTQAQGESGHWRPDRARFQRDLRDNQPRNVGAILDSPVRCRDRYTPERWDSFQRDVAFFSSHISPERWTLMLRDHGYNATPLWTTFGGVLMGDGPLSEAKLGWLAAIDALLYVATIGLIGATFGLEAATLALVVLALGNPWSFDWTGGSVGRVPWFFLSAMTLCALERGRYHLAGAAIVGASMLRVFPLLFALAFGLRALLDVSRERRIEWRWWQMLAGAGFALLLLLGVIALGNGSGAWGEFARNSEKHLETSLGNNMGLTAVVAASLGGSDATHPGDAREAREGQGGGSVLPALVYFALALLLFGTVFEAARRCSEATVLFAASLLVPIAAGDLTSYYYVFLVLLAPLAVARFRRMAALLAMVIATQAVVLTGLQGPGLYATQTLVVLCAAGFTIWDMIALRGGSQRAGWSLTRGTPAIEALRAPPERVREAGL